MPRPVPIACPKSPAPVPVVLARDLRLTSTEHVVSDADPGGGLAHRPLNNGQVYHLQDVGLNFADAGCPRLSKVAPACHPPFIPSLEQASGKERDPMRIGSDSIQKLPDCQLYFPETNT